MQHTLLFDRKGFTLVEAIVAGTLSVFVLLIAMALYRMNADQIRGSFLRSLTRMQYQTIIEQIESNARQATAILPFNDRNSFRTDTSAETTNVIYFLSDTGATLGGYQRSGNILQELKGGFTNFKVGNKTFQVDTVKPFIVQGDRKSVQLNLTVFGADGSLKDTVSSKGEKFTCRN